jgi:two-component system response regulator BaeR
MSSTHILIVEDEPEIAEILKDYMINEGYKASCIENGDEVISFVEKENPSLILLDLMIPGIDGKTVCREIRKFSDVPIIMITAKVEEIDRIIGFELGVDDYICKPFSPREVVVRVKAVLRRSSAAATPSDHVLSAGPIQLNTDTRQVTIHNTEIELTPNEFDILNVMIARPNNVFSRSQLIDQVQGYNFEGYERTIDFHIKNLRKKIATYFPDQKIIQSVYGVGYKLVPGS